MIKSIFSELMYDSYNKIVDDNSFEVSSLVCKNYFICNIPYFTENSIYSFNAINNSLEKQDKIFQNVYSNLDTFYSFLLNYNNEKYKDIYTAITSSLDLSYTYICSYDNLVYKKLTLPKEEILITCVSLGEKIYNLINSSNVQNDCNNDIEVSRVILEFIQKYGFPSFKFDYTNMFAPEFKIQIQELTDSFIYIYKLFEIYNVLSITNISQSKIPECIKDWIHYSSYNNSTSIDEHISKYLSEYSEIIDIYIHDSIKFMYNEKDGIFELKVFNTDMITYAFYELSKLFQYRTSNIRRCKVCDKLFLGTRKTNCICDHCKQYEYEAYKKRLQRSRLKMSKENKDSK